MSTVKNNKIFDDISKFFVYNSLLKTLNYTETDLVMGLIKFKKIEKKQKNIPDEILNNINKLTFSK